MKKKISLIICVFFIFANIYSQGMLPVYDPAVNNSILTEFVTALTELYEMYDQTMNQIQMIEQNYERMQFYIDRAKTWDFNEVQWDGDLDFRNEIMDATSQINSQLTNIRQIRNSLTAKTVSFGGKSFSFASLCGINQGDNFGNVKDFVEEGFDYYQDGFRNACLNFAEGVPDSEAQYIWSKYGLNPANYQMVREVENCLAEKASYLFGNADEELQQQNTNYRQWYSKMEEIMKMLNADGATDGQLMQAQGLLLQQTCFTMKQMQDDLNRGMSYYAWYNRWKDQTEESKRQSQQEKLMKEEDNSLPNYF